MTRLRRDIDDMDLVDAIPAKVLRADRAEQRARWEQGDRLQNEVDASRKASTVAWVRNANAQQVEDSYRAARVEPPLLGEGVKRCSLPLLLTIGWRIEELPDGSRVLVKPPPPPAARAPTSAYQITTPEPKAEGGKK